MANRIPPSLKWLIDKRARLDGEIKKMQTAAKAAQKLILELSQIEGDLAAIDRALKLHELQVDVDLIEPIRSHYKRLKIPHGELTRSIFLCLRMAKEEPTSTDHLASFVGARLEFLGVPQDRKDLLRSVRYRLKCLASEGKIQRHKAKGNTAWLWGSDDSTPNDPVNHHAL